MVRQKFLDRLLDQDLHRHAAQDGGKLELAVFKLGNAGAELDPGFDFAGRPLGNGCCWGAVLTRIRAGFWGGGDVLFDCVLVC